jgi:hypothetical protein
VRAYLIRSWRLFSMKPNVITLQLHRLLPSVIRAKSIYNQTWRRNMASATQALPGWTQPQPSYRPEDLNLVPPLKVSNSLTRAKDTFLPQKKDVVTW